MEEAVEPWSKQSSKERLECLHKTGYLSDCEFVVQHKGAKSVFQVHRLILAMSSPVFKAMFYGGMREEGTVNVTDVDPDAFRILLEYVYTDNLQLTNVEKACEVLAAANKYMIPHLKENCENFLITILNPDNVFYICEFAEKFEGSTLKEKCFQVFASNIREAVLNFSFNGLSSSNILAVLLDQDELCVQSEMELYNLLQLWAARECMKQGLTVTPENQRTILGPALSKIRFLTMTPEEFLSIPAQAGLLTSEETLAIVDNMFVPGSRPIPNSLSSNAQTRGIRRPRGTHGLPLKRFPWEVGLFIILPALLILSSYDFHEHMQDNVNLFWDSFVNSLYPKPAEPETFFGSFIPQYNGVESLSYSSLYNQTYQFLLALCVISLALLVILMRWCNI